MQRSSASPSPSHLTIFFFWQRPIQREGKYSESVSSHVQLSLANSSLQIHRAGVCLPPSLCSASGSISAFSSMLGHQPLRGRSPLETRAPVLLGSYFCCPSTLAQGGTGVGKEIYFLPLYQACTHGSPRPTYRVLSPPNSEFHVFYYEDFYSQSQPCPGLFNSHLHTPLLNCYLIMSCIQTSNKQILTVCFEQSTAHVRIQRKRIRKVKSDT